MLKRGILLFLITLSLIYSSNALIGDFDLDGCVKFSDFTMFAKYYGTNLDKMIEGEFDVEAENYDLNKDRKVDFEDFSIFAEDYGECEEAKGISKFLIVAYDRNEKLNYGEGEEKVIDAVLKTTVNPNKYEVYVLTTPGLSNLRVYLYKKEGKEWSYIKDFKPEFIGGAADSFFGAMEEKKSADIYKAEFNIDDLTSGEYWIVIRYNNLGGGNSYWGLAFEIVNPGDYNLNEKCNMLHESKYPEEDSINIAFIGDVYPYNELFLYAYDVERVLKVFLEDPTIKPYENRINVYRANYISEEGQGDLECRYGGECITYLAPISKIIGLPERLLCCNANKVESKIKNLCGDRPYIMNVINNEEKWAGAVMFSNDNPLLFVSNLIDLFRDYVLKKKETGITAQNQAKHTMASSYIFSHEIGHLVAGLPDYYEIDPDCERYKCKMCDSQYEYADTDVCYDKQGMVKWLNQYCKGKVEIFKDKETFKKYNSFWSKTRISPYPNPFNPVAKDLGDRNTTVEFNLEYEKGEEPCYVLMNVYNVDGQLIDMVVSEEVLEEGNHKLIWNGKNLDNETVASGIYIYEVNLGDAKDSVKGTLIK